MSLKLQVELADLEKEAAELQTKRNELYSTEIQKIIDQVKTDADNYLKGLGLTSRSTNEKLTYSASGKDWVSINYSGLHAIGYALQLFDIYYNEKEYKIRILIDIDVDIPSQGTISGTEAENLQKKIAFHNEKLLPALRESASKQLPGTYVLVWVKDGPNNETYSDMRSLLEKITA